jgi:hypothetical protein
MLDAKFEEHLTQVEKVAWSSFKNIPNNFWEILRLKMFNT